MSWKINDHYSKNILDKLIELKRTNKLKQKDFIGVLGTNKSIISEIFKGKRNVTLPMLINLKQKYPEMDLNKLLSNE